jgi:cob(I)alamin adenosyltransferase
MAPFFTRSGDDGNTGILGKGRIPKHHPRMEALGTVDEATAALGVARSLSTIPETQTLILETQRDLYHLMAELAASPEEAQHFRKLDRARMGWLESTTEALGATVTIPGEFILPGDTPAGAALSLARTIVRRAERRIAGLLHEGEIDNPLLMQYLNRLSSLCFVLELRENQQAGQETRLAKEDKSASQENRTQ